MKLESRLLEHIYIHMPFCLRKCGYCSFYSELYDSELKQKYLTFLLKEICLWQKNFTIKPKTIFFGGGTPSLLSGSEISRILDQFDLSQIQEITLEANPVNISPEYANDLANTKINRISLGVQSLDDNELKLLGRLHNSDQALQAFQYLRNEGFDNISFDLMYGLPNQKFPDLAASIEKYIQYAPDHISTYCLSLQEDVPLYPMKAEIPQDERISDFYFTIREKLLQSGYLQYEISNFTKPAFESKHNLCYWDDKPYLGLGPAAAGYLYIEDQEKRSWIRYTNPDSFPEYFTFVSKEHYRANFVNLAKEDHEKEFIFLSLRKVKGLNLKEFKTIFGIDFIKKYQNIIDKYQRIKLLEIEAGFIRLLPEAYFVSNEIFSEFM